MDGLFLAGEQRSERHAVGQASAVRAAADGNRLKSCAHCLVVHVDERGYKLAVAGYKQRLAGMPGYNVEFRRRVVAQQLVHVVATVTYGEADVHRDVKFTLARGAQYAKVAGKVAAAGSFAVTVTLSPCV